jgi:hypothetical protein
MPRCLHCSGTLQEIASGDEHRCATWQCPACGYYEFGQLILGDCFVPAADFPYAANLPEQLGQLLAAIAV